MSRSLAMFWLAVIPAGCLTVLDTIAAVKSGRWDALVEMGLCIGGFWVFMYLIIRDANRYFE